MRDQVRSGCQTRIRLKLDWVSMPMLLAAALAGTVAFAQTPPPQADRALKAPDCQTLVMTSPGPGVIQLCQGEAAMRRGEAAGADSAEGRRQLAGAASELERAADALREVESEDLRRRSVDPPVRRHAPEAAA